MPTTNEIEVLRAARQANITARDELANFMAQLSHESGGLTRKEESFRYTRGIHQIPVPSAFREGRERLEAAHLAALDGRPQELARLMYGGRMGNDDAGDGYLYRGRGFNQLTGEENYRTAGAALGLDLTTNPDLASNMENAARISVWYWQERVPQADRDDVSAATLAINGGYNGLRDRHERFDAWHALLTPEFLADLDAGRVRPGAGVGPIVGLPAMEDGALRRFESGMDVRQLQIDLQALDMRDARGRRIATTGTYDQGTEQSIRGFQEAHGLPVTGRANQQTLEVIQDVLQRQQARVQLDGGPAAPPMGLAGGNGELEGLQGLRVDGIPSGHRDYALFEAIRQNLPEETTLEKVAEVAMRAKTEAGILRPEQIDAIFVQAERVFVIGKVPGFRTDANLSTPAPEFRDSMRSMEAFDRQLARPAQFPEQRESINQNQVAPGVSSRSLA